MARDEYGLSPRQRAWCDEYIKSGNGIDAARKAGYSNPKKSSENNRDNRACCAYVAERMRPTVEKRIADADEVLLYLSRVMRGELKDQFGLEISIQDRTKAAQELMKRYAVADQRQQSTLQRLDSLFIEFRAALGTPPTSDIIELTEDATTAQPTAATTPTQGAQGTDAATPTT